MPSSLERSQAFPHTRLRLEVVSALPAHSPGGGLWKVAGLKLTTRRRHKKSKQVSNLPVQFIRTRTEDFQEVDQFVTERLGDT